MTKKKKKTKNSIVPIVYCLDKKFIEYTKFSIDSLLHDNPNAVIELIVPEHIEELSQYKQHICSNDALKDVYLRDFDRITAFTYARLFIPELLKEYDKCIYMDGDIIVRRNLDEAMNMDIPYIGAALEQRPDWLLEGIEKDVYYNAGFLVLNLKNLRKDNFTKKCLQFIFDHDESYLGKEETWLHDQTTINSLYSEKITKLDQSFNTQLNWNPPTPYEEITEDKTNLHFLTDYNKLSFIKYCYERYEKFPSINKIVDCILILNENDNVYDIDQTIKSVLKQAFSNIKLHIFCMHRNSEINSYFKQLESDKIILTDASALKLKRHVFSFIKNNYKYLTSNNIILLNEHSVIHNNTITELLSNKMRNGNNLCFAFSRDYNDPKKGYSLGTPKDRKVLSLFYIKQFNRILLTSMDNFKNFDFEKTGFFPEDEFLNYLILKDPKIEFNYGMANKIYECVRNMEKYDNRLLHFPMDATFMIKRTFERFGLKLNFNEARFLNPLYTKETVLTNDEKRNIKRIRKHFEKNYKDYFNMDMLYHFFKI